MRVFVLFIFLISLVACDKGAKSPEGLINMYVKDLTTSKVDKEYFKKYTTGKLWESVEGLEDDEFKKFIDLSKVKNPRVKILNKNCVVETCTMTYIVKYEVHLDKKDKFASEVKKIAILLKEGEDWKISEVTNVKTYLEAKTSIEVAP